MSLSGQTITGSITGLVSDPSGAIITNAKVIATDTSKNLKYETTTNISGIYTFLFLPVSSYTVAVEGAGFKKSVIGPFKLETNQTARVDVALQVGAVSESVEITDVAPILQTESTQTGENLTGKRITEIPLNGRNLVSAVLLIPGAVQTNPSSVNTATRFSGRAFVNGNREQTNNFLLDGADVNDSMDNRIGYTPSPDALEEVQVITGNGSSEFGNSAGAVVSMTIKSGTNRFHGSAYEFLRNEKLDANSFFGNQNTSLPREKQRRALRQNLFGATLGGRIKRDKLFFFVDYDGTQNRNSGPALTSLVPAEWRTGDLSRLTQQIFDPATCVTTGTTRTCQQFPNKQIPASRIVNPAARALFADRNLYPLPNQTGQGPLGISNNYGGSAANFVKNNQGDAKIDWRPTDKDTAFFRYSHGFYTDGSLTAVVPTSPAGVKEAPTLGAVAGWTHTLTPRMVNDFRYAYTRTVIIDTFSDFSGQGAGGNAKLGIPGGQLAPGFSSIAVGDGVSNVGTAGVLSDGKDNKFHLSENVTYQLNRHLLRFGVNGVRYQQNRFYSGNNGALGSFGYDARFSNSAFADFLLDQLATKGRGQGDGRRWGQRHWRFGTFFQDDFKVRNNLTLNLGMRWEYTQPLYEVNNLQANIDQVNATLRIAGQGGNSRALYNPYYKQFMPRVGFAWTPDMFKQKLVVRAAYGITSFLEGTGVNLRLPLNPPYFFESNIIYADLNSPGSIRVGFTDLPPFTGQLAGNIRTWDPDLRPQFTQQRNFSLEYQFSNTLAASAAYVSQRATHTIVARDRNQPLPGVGAPATWTAAQTRRPLYPFAPAVTTTATTESSGIMNYDSLQMSLRKRYSTGVDFSLSYTLSKTLNDALGFFGAGGVNAEGAYWQNAYDRRANYGVAAWDAKHNLTLSGNYQLPFGKGKKFGSNAGRATDLVLGGWNAGFILQGRSGFPVTISNTDRSLQAGRGTARPNRLRALNLDGRGINNWFGSTNSLICARDAAGNATDNGVCAYQDPSNGFFGNAGIGTERMPNYFNWDMSVNKRFTVKEGHYVEFRTELFNFLNTVAFGAPARGINTPATFGVISSQANSPRNIQFGLKYIF